MYEPALAVGKVIEVFQEYPGISFIRVEIPVKSLPGPSIITISPAG